jgi:hypothetical protein
MLWLFVALKVPLIAACWIVWWAIRQEPEPEEAVLPPGEGGQRTRPHPPPRLPHAPRRGPHGEQALPSPPRIRTVSARARSSTR